jgi:psp operon transcriptional activator
MLAPVTTQAIVAAAVPAANDAFQEYEVNDVEPVSFADRVLAFERRLIDEAMRAEDDHQGKSAERLGLSYHQFRGLLRKHGLKK